MGCPSDVSDDFPFALLTRAASISIPIVNSFKIANMAETNDLSVAPPRGDCDGDDRASLDNLISQAAKLNVADETMHR